MLSECARLVSTDGATDLPKHRRAASNARPREEGGLVGVTLVLKVAARITSCVVRQYASAGQADNAGQSTTHVLNANR